MTELAQVDLRASVINIINELSPERLSEALEFVLLLKAQQIKQSPTDQTRPLKRLEELWSDFWPEDESTEDFINTVRRWRREDALLHRPRCMGSCMCLASQVPASHKQCR